ncbi:MAG: Txe/YoeB family addiction module toxin [Tannerella sp.]|jgi:toxin YoeB|nr:Txe/YoeB family addiction module toxin [Tannerella sp.]
MGVIFTPKAMADLQYWKDSGNLNIQARITALLKSIQTTPFEGIGKPEALKYELSGKWSRRIDKEHRLVYQVSEGMIRVYSLRGHYLKP